MNHPFRCRVECAIRKHGRRLDAISADEIRGPPEFLGEMHPRDKQSEVQSAARTNAPQDRDKVPIIGSVACNDPDLPHAFTCRHEIRLSAGIPPRAVLPISLSMSRGEIPDPGRFTVSMLLRIWVPAGILTLATTLFLAGTMFCRSLDMTRFLLSPRASSVSRICATNRRSPAGSRDAR